MQFLTAIKQRWTTRWKRAFGASLTIALLTAVAVAGITLLGSEVVAAWKTPGSAEQTLASDTTFTGLLSLEAPAATVARLKIEKEDAEKGQANSEAVLAKNWKYTAVPTLLDYLQNPLLIYIEGLQLQALANAFQTFLPNSPLTAFVTNFTKTFLQTANTLLTTTLHLPPVPTASPFS